VFRLPIIEMSKKSFIDVALEKGYEPNPQIVNNDAILRRIEPGTEKNHQRQMERWKE
jgi:hypothetical protein